MRTKATRSLLKGMCWLNSFWGNGAADSTLHLTRIWGGPLRGKQFAMPELERLAFALGNYEKDVVDIIKAHAHPGSVVYDLGANAGYLTMIVADAVESKGKVFAFEPDPRNFNALEANIRLNKLSHVTAVPKAVSNDIGTITFAAYEYSLVGHIIRPNTSEDATLLEVPTTTLDEFVFGQGHPPPDFIKIDVEGSEELVLQGAERVLAEIRPTLIIETRSGWMWDHVSTIMTGHGYKYTFLAGAESLETDYYADVLFEPL